jgi:HEAT repeat protein
VLSRLSDEAERPGVRAVAARTAGRRCQGSAVQALFDLLKRGVEPMAKRQDIEAAVVAAAALGELGTPEARVLLEKAARRSNPIIDKAITEALAREKTDCAVPGAR